MNEPKQELTDLIDYMIDNIFMFDEVHLDYMPIVRYVNILTEQYQKQFGEHYRYKFEKAGGMQ